MSCTREQNAALDDWVRGCNVVLRAPPGTGKTWMIIEACKRVVNPIDAEASSVADVPAPTCLVIAYNTELAADVSRKIDEHGLQGRVACYTFHALCTHCISLAADDRALESCVRAASCGKVPVTRIPAAHVLIDEAQDMTRLHVSLLSLVLGSNGSDADSTENRGRHYFVAGDEHQMLYDYGPYPSDVSLMQNCGTTFSSMRPWRRHQLTGSRRITHGMARLVDCHFGTGLRSLHETTTTTTDGNAAGSKTATTLPSVVVHGATKWALGRTFLSILEPHILGGTLECVSILAATKKNNFPLTLALNHLSEHNVPLYVHGVDGSHADVRSKKVRVSSFHSSKGTECDTAIVLVPPRAKKNPLYVALTRARRSLHIVLVKDDCDPRLCRTLERMHEEQDAMPSACRVSFYDSVARAVTVAASARFVSSDGDGDGEDGDGDGDSEQMSGGRRVKQRRSTSAVAASAASAASDAMHRSSLQGDSGAAATIESRSVSLDSGRDLDRLHRFVTSKLWEYPNTEFPPTEGSNADSSASPLSGPLVTLTRDQCSENVSDLYVDAALCALEHEYTGRVRRMEDVIAPGRFVHTQHATVVSSGYHGRYVSPYVTDASLLSNDLRRVANEAYARRKGSVANEETDADTARMDFAAEWCTIAATATSWNGYHHRMRQILPTSAWVDADVFFRVLRRIRGILFDSNDDEEWEHGIQFDVRLRRTVECHLAPPPPFPPPPSTTTEFPAPTTTAVSTVVFHARAHAVDSRGAWHFVWGTPTAADVDAAGARAVLHPRGVCRLVGVLAHELVIVECADPEQALSYCCA